MVAAKFSEYFVIYQKAMDMGATVWFTGLSGAGKTTITSSELF